MPTRLAEITRGGAVESVHFGVVVVVDVTGNVAASVGDVEHVAFFRSSAKPFQAIPLVETGTADAFGLTPAERALCCAFHAASPEHQAQVAAMLAKFGLDDKALRCGISLPMDEAEAARITADLAPPSPLQCDCSGKHAGMLATCVHLGLPTEFYLDPNHPLQRQVLDVIAKVTRQPASEIQLGTDGRGLPTFGTSIRAFATAYATLASPADTPTTAGRQHAAALRRLREAMAAHPGNVAGDGMLVTDLMTLSGGAIVAKSGAEGLLCLAIPDRGLGIAIRILDGSFRAHAVVACRILDDLELVLPSVTKAILARHDPRIFSHNGRQVGDIRTTFSLSGA